MALEETGKEQMYDTDFSGKNITQEQFSQLFQLLQHVKSGQQGKHTSDANATANWAGIIQPHFNPLLCFSRIDSSSWILDSGATEHMTYDNSILSDIRPLLKLVFVNLPNSQKVRVNQIGMARILLNLTLKNVLFVPGFRFNLLSVYRLTKTLDCHLLFCSFAALFSGPFNEEAHGTW